MWAHETRIRGSRIHHRPRRNQRGAFGNSETGEAAFARGRCVEGSAAGVLANGIRAQAVIAGRMAGSAHSPTLVLTFYQDFLFRNVFRNGWGIFSEIPRGGASKNRTYDLVIISDAL